MDDFKSAHLADILNKSGGDIGKLVDALEAEEEAFFGLTLNEENAKRCRHLNNICHRMEAVGEGKVRYFPSEISERSRNYLATVYFKPCSCFFDNRVALLLSHALRNCDDFSMVSGGENDEINLSFGVRDVWSDWELDPDRGEKFRIFGK